MPRERKGVSKPPSQTSDTRRYFVVASEGADTERIYFQGLQDLLIEKGISDTLIKLEFLERKTEKERAQSSHKSVLKQLDAYKKTYRLDNRDELWLVIDRDKQNNRVKNIADIAQNCLQKGYFLALSNPNFEFWLLLHLKDLIEYSEIELNKLHDKKAGESKSVLEKELSALLGGYNKSKYDIRKILPFIDKAILQAKNLDTNLEERWIEDRLGTRVYLLVERIISIELNDEAIIHLNN